MTKPWEYQIHEIKNDFKGNKKRIHPKRSIIIISKFGYNHLAGPLGCLFLSISEKDFAKTNGNIDSIMSKSFYVAACFVDANKIQEEENEEDNIILKLLHKHLTKLQKKGMFAKNSTLIVDNVVNIKAERFKSIRFKPRFVESDLEKTLMAKSEEIGTNWLKKHMKKISKKYPVYNFEQHLGKATQNHFEEINSNGYTPEHRRNLTPIEKLGSIEKCMKFVKESDFNYDEELLSHLNEKEYYVGIDEVGVESLAGPMVASAVILPNNHSISRLPIDSKDLKADTTIVNLAKEVKENVLFSVTFSIDGHIVDEFGTQPSSEILWYACAKKVREYLPNIEIVIDGKYGIPETENVTPIIKADTTHDNVSAAAIYSKWVCDNELREFHKEDNRYNFSKHKGYHTVEHLKNIDKFGISAFHRKKMTEKRMAEGYELDELYLSINQLKKMVRLISDIYNDYPKLFDEFAENLFIGNSGRIFKGIHPSPKVTYYLRKIYYSLVDKANKKNIKIRKEIFEGERPENIENEQIKNSTKTVTVKMENCFENAVQLFREIIDLAKNHNKTIHQPTKVFLRRVYDEKIKNRKALSDEEFLKLNRAKKRLENQKVRPKEDTSIATHFRTYDLYSKGLSVEEISNKRKVGKSTIVKHLIECFALGLFVDISPFYNDNFEDEIIQCINKVGFEKLKPIKDKLPKEVSYNDIRIAAIKKGYYKPKKTA